MGVYSQRREKKVKEERENDERRRKDADERTMSAVTR